MSVKTAANPGTRTERAPGPNPSMKRRKPSLGQRIWRERWSYTFIVPGALFFLVFAYVPMLGNVVAFQQYSPFRGIEGSPWVGFANFNAIWADPEVLTALRNTLIIAVLQLVLAFPAPIALALLLNSLISDRIKRMVQTVVYLPYFLSWVIVISVWQQVLGGGGLVAGLLDGFGVSGFDAMSNADTFKLLVVAQGIWKDCGWGTIIFFAAIAGIPNDRYEAAAIDGATPWQRTWHITLPALVPVATLLLILNIGSILTVGFEQLLLQQPMVGADAAQVIDTFVYFRGVLGGQWGIATAAGLLKGVIGTILVLSANRVAKRLGGEGIF
ncbi:MULTISPECIES: ABC transporter permease [Glycomyces]|uniref:ABC transporter permease subunit n=2 Tax=Glycomyces TaxID=58113 RepID=A0A9X3SY72_9ACTN|nr:ABC transporter permease subunit [Glycomyces lechevalierae]MDA1385921.1 ABC transporter permease subunit [Glycomyces lechevalierae]MDR7340922.1 putative aldouronate transport system permease protein [Glycomyces lechevalierae]